MWPNQIQYDNIVFSKVTFHMYYACTCMFFVFICSLINCVLSIARMKFCRPRFLLFIWRKSSNKVFTQMAHYSEWMNFMSKIIPFAGFIRLNCVSHCFFPKTQPIFLAISSSQAKGSFYFPQTKTLRLWR